EQTFVNPPLITQIAEPVTTCPPVAVLRKTKAAKANGQTVNYRQASKERFSNDDIDAILVWLEHPPNYDKIYGTSRETSVGKPLRSAAKGLIIMETGFGIKDEDRANGIHRLEHKRESLYHAYDRLEALFGQKPYIVPVAEKTCEPDGDDHDEEEGPSDADEDVGELLAIRDSVEQKIAWKQQVFENEKEDRKTEREDKLAESQRLMEMEDKKLSAQMELEARKLETEDRKLQAQLEMEEKRLKKQKEARKFQLVQVALTSGRGMEDIQAVFKLGKYVNTSHLNLLYNTSSDDGFYGCLF
ncbi:hypothetical protein BGZ75_000696, partial [Mortierella antarctica]